jgi:hypothetical protein
MERMKKIKKKRDKIKEKEAENQETDIWNERKKKGRK